MNLRELDREQSELDLRYSPWDVTLRCRRLSAWELIELNEDFAEVHGADANSKDLLNFYCNILEMSVIKPQATAEEWKRDISLGTLLDIGEHVCRAIGLTVDVEKKSESSDHLADSQETSQENLDSQT